MSWRTPAKTMRRSRPASHTRWRKAGVAVWADQLLAAIDAPRPRPADANRQVAASAFSIQHSAEALERLYRNGVLA